MDFFESKGERRKKERKQTNKNKNKNNKTKKSEKRKNEKKELTSHYDNFFTGLIRLKHSSW